MAMIECKNAEYIDQKPQHRHYDELCGSLKSYWAEQASYSLENDTSADPHKQDSIGETSENLEILKTKRVKPIGIHRVLQQHPCNEAKRQRCTVQGHVKRITQETQGFQPKRVQELHKHKRRVEHKKVENGTRVGMIEDLRQKMGRVWRRCLWRRKHVYLVQNVDLYA